MKIKVDCRLSRMMKNKAKRSEPKNSTEVDLVEGMSAIAQDFCISILSVLSEFWHSNDASGYGYEFDDDEGMCISVHAFQLRDEKNKGDERKYEDIFNEVADFFRPKDCKYTDQEVFAVFNECGEYISEDGEDIKSFWKRIKANPDTNPYKNYNIVDVSTPWMKSIWEKTMLDPIGALAVIEKTYDAWFVENGNLSVISDDDGRDITFRETIQKGINSLIQDSKRKNL